MRSERRAGLAFIFITLLIDVIGFGIVIPVLPSLVGKLAGGTPDSQAGVYGILLAVYGLMQFLCAPILGNESPVSSRHRYMAIWRAMTRWRPRLGPVSSSMVRPK